MVDHLSALGGVRASGPSALLRSLGRITPLGVINAILVSALIAPIIAVFLAAMVDSGDLWVHLLETVMPRYVANSLLLMFGVAVVSLLFGVSTAWVVTRYDFPARSIVEWMLLLPAAIPAYLIAYTYTDFLEYAGPVQVTLRAIFGWQNARDYWFPEIRSMEGAWLVMGAVLYPYVYMMARSAFLLTPASFFEIGMVSGRSLFWSVGLPLARPAIIAGLALVLMETLSDFGTVEYFAIETLTLGIFNVWLGMNSLAAAAQISIVAFLFVVGLLAVELRARASRSYIDTGKRSASLPAVKTRGWRSVGCLAVCLIPIAAGFVLPVGILLTFVAGGQSTAFNSAVLTAATNSFMLAIAVALTVMAVATITSLYSTYRAGPLLKQVTAVSAIGYAFPGTILAIGVLTVGTSFDAATDWLSLAVFGEPHGGWIAGSLALVVIACSVRFQAIGYGAMTSGLGRISPNLVQASRTLGHTFGETVWTIVIPLVKKSLLAGALLVFVDVMKELPMTLLLRPFNYETLATYVYQFAKDELLEEAALPALIIVCTGIPAVIFMNLALRRLSR